MRTKSPHPFAFAALALTVLALPACASAQATSSPQSALLAATSAAAPAAFTLPNLPYAYDALASVIDAQTMELHHLRHHGAQVAGLNSALAANRIFEGLSLEQLFARTSTLPPSIRNNAGGHWNHSFFWTIMAPVGQGGSPSPELAAAIVRDFGSMDAFKAQFRSTSLSRFGSGWVWLVKKSDGKLAITSTPNQDNPLMDVAEVRGTPILGNDVWEHAYYLKYQNKRADYVDAWWNVVNWAEVSRRFGS
jgi:superoxide dismutase, Fe-Mn family